MAGSSAGAKAGIRGSAATIAIHRMGFPSSDMERHGLRDVIIVACGVWDQLLGLDLADLVRRAGGERQFAAPLGDKLVAPGAKSEFAGIFSERRFCPALAIVGRDFDGTDAIAAVPGDPAYGRLASRLGARSIGRVCDERVHDNLGNR